MPHVDEELRRLLDSDDPKLDQDLRKLALATTLWILLLLLVVVVFAEWVTR